ncbi:MAG TPA: hypothetical protein VFK47_07145, partial [Ktedonobacteraceae bacterium]|nr:hypothetical protein [Ktedonobacteraceae bacterium]
SSSTKAPAPAPSTPSAFKISPVRTDLSLDPGTSKTITVYVQNIQPVAVAVRVSISDFEPSHDESGKPEVLLDDTKYAESHSLKRLASATPSTLTLQPNQNSSVLVTVTAPKTALAGGYYGAVRFLPTSDKSPDGSGLSLSTNVGSLILLKVNGEIKEKMTLASLDVRQKEDKFQTFFTKPNNIMAVARFTNEGNVQEEPFGKVQLYKGKKLIQEVEINNTNPRGNVLPDSTRRFDAQLDKVGKFGKYTVKGNFGWGSGQTLSSSVTFWVVPVPYIIAAISLVALLILAIIFIPLMLRSYNRRILAKAGRGRRY